MDLNKIKALNYNTIKRNYDLSYLLSDRCENGFMFGLFSEALYIGEVIYFMWIGTDHL